MRIGAKRRHQPEALASVDKSAFRTQLDARGGQCAHRRVEKDRKHDVAFDRLQQVGARHLREDVRKLARNRICVTGIAQPEVIFEIAQELRRREARLGQVVSGALEAPLEIRR